MSRGEVGDTLRYFEAGQMEAVMSRGNSRKLTRGQSSNSLKPGARGKDLNPEALSPFYLPCKIWGLNFCVENFHQCEVLFVQAAYNYFHAAKIHFLQL